MQTEIRKHPLLLFHFSCHDFSHQMVSIGLTNFSIDMAVLTSLELGLLMHLAGTEPLSSSTSADSK